MRYCVQDKYGRNKVFDWSIGPNLIQYQEFICECGGNISHVAGHRFKCNKCHGNLTITPREEELTGKEQAKDYYYQHDYNEDIGYCELVGYEPAKIFKYIV